ncbi:MAG: sugar-binding protein [Nitrososphaerales archaeon]
MKKSILRSPFTTCPKTGRITGIRRPAQLPLIVFPAAGFLALLWFLIRVVPKPSRAAYPCQRVAAPLAGNFLAWAAGVGGATVAFRRARARLAEARYAAASVALAVAVAAIGWAVLSQAGRGAAALAPVAVAPTAYAAHPANAPLGAARGFAPGRVAWAHDPKVTTWDGTSTAPGQRWYDKVNEGEATSMMQWAILGYAGADTTAEAWDAIFRRFNRGAAYHAGDKVFIKINLTTSNAPNCADSNYNWNPSGCGASWTSVGQSPQLMIALLDQLVNVVGVAQPDITIGDSTGLWVNELYNPVHNSFPNVKYLDARGANGRTLGTRSTTRIYWSTDEANGKHEDYLLQAAVDAKYVIDFAILKSHELAGVTLTAKNHFGSFSGGNSDERKPVTTGYYNWHLRLPLETVSDAWEDRGLMAQYRPLVDMNAHAGMGGKTVLYLLDAIYSGRGWAGNPSKWRVPPFCTGAGCASAGVWPASLFLSMDPVAIDSVGFDFLSQRTDWTEVLQAEGVQDYLHEMALANAPPSGTVYDPEHDGQAAPGQGAHEHWNGVARKQYRRNLGTGAGVELLYLPGDPTKNAAVRRTDQPLAIDGSVEAVWTAAPEQTLGNVVLGDAAISGPSDLSGSYRALYDAANLYLLVDVNDERLVKDSPAWYDDDSVAVLIDGDYSRAATYDGANDFELGFRWNDPAISRGANSAPVPAGAAFALVATGTGYRLEVKLPLAGLGLPAGYGQVFGLDVQANDDDGEPAARDAKIAWWAKDDTSSANPSAFGAGRLQGPEQTSVTLANEGTAVRLKWTHYAWDDAYEVHKSTAPYFAPDARTRVRELAAPENEYLDLAPGSATYYVVQARQDGLAVSSNRTGRFTFGLVR